MDRKLIECCGGLIGAMTVIYLWLNVFGEEAAKERRARRYRKMAEEQRRLWRNYGKPEPPKIPWWKRLWNSRNEKDGGLERI